MGYLTDQFNIPVDDRGRALVQVRIGDTAFGTIRRKTIKREDGPRVNSNGRLFPVQDPTGECYIQVTTLPRDLNTNGYE